MQARLIRAHFLAPLKWLAAAAIWAGLVALSQAASAQSASVAMDRQQCLASYLHFESRGVGLLPGDPDPGVYCPPISETDSNPNYAAAVAMKFFFEQRYALALSLARQARAEGSARGSLLLGEAYELGLGIDPDLAYAAQLYQEAAEAGNATAQYRLGMLHSQQWSSLSGLERDTAVAANYFRLAGLKGHYPAQVELSRAFAIGAGVGQDRDVAQVLAVEAACAGYWPAIVALGEVSDAATALAHVSRLSPDDLTEANVLVQIGGFFFDMANQDGERTAQELARVYAWWLPAYFLGALELAEFVGFNDDTPLLSGEFDERVLGLDALFETLTGTSPQLGQSGDPSLALVRLISDQSLSDMLAFGNQELQSAAALAQCR